MVDNIRMRGMKMEGVYKTKLNNDVDVVHTGRVRSTEGRGYYDASHLMAEALKHQAVIANESPSTSDSNKTLLQPPHLYSTVKYSTHMYSGDSPPTYRTQSPQGTSPSSPTAYVADTTAFIEEPPPSPYDIPPSSYELLAGRRPLYDGSSGEVAPPFQSSEAEAKPYHGVGMTSRSLQAVIDKMIIGKASL